jgi:precorrin-6B methylase 2
MFSNDKGLQELAEMASVARLIVIHLIPGFEFDSLNAVQEDLRGLVPSLLHEKCTTKSIPFMTNGNIGERHLVYSSGNIIVEDVKVNDYYRREMLFLKNVNQVQSEVKLIEREGERARIYRKSLTCEYMRVMLTGMFTQSREDMRVLVLGAGAGCFPMFLREYFGGVMVDAVEIDQEVIEIGERFFEFRQNDMLNIINTDALQYVSSCMNSDIKYDLIFIDINGSDSSSTPPDSFRSSSFINDLNSLLTQEGSLIINTILSPSSSSSFYQALTSIFPLVYSAKCEEDCNLIAFAYKHCTVSPNELSARYQAFSDHNRLDKSMSFSDYISNYLPFASHLVSQDSSSTKKKRRRRKK